MPVVGVSYDLERGLDGFVRMRGMVELSRVRGEAGRGVGAEPASLDDSAEKSDDSAVPWRPNPGLVELAIVFVVVCRSRSLSRGS